jgi:hypothetical protein
VTSKIFLTKLIRYLVIPSKSGIHNVHLVIPSKSGIHNVHLVIGDVPKVVILKFFQDLITENIQDFEIPKQVRDDKRDVFDLCDNQ